MVHTVSFLALFSEQRNNSIFLSPGTPDSNVSDAQEIVQDNAASCSLVCPKSYLGKTVQHVLQLFMGTKLGAYGAMYLPND